MSEEQRRQGCGLSLEERKVKFSSAPRLQTALRGPRKKIAISARRLRTAPLGVQGGNRDLLQHTILDSSQQVPADFISAAGHGQLPRLRKSLVS